MKVLLCAITIYICIFQKMAAHGGYTLERKPEFSKKWTRFIVIIRCSADKYEA